MFTSKLSTAIRKVSQHHAALQFLKASSCTVPALQTPIGLTPTREFAKFFKKKKSLSQSMEVYDFNAIEEKGLSLENGIESLPPKMVKRLKMNGVDDLFRVQQAVYNLFVNQQNELVVKSKTGTGKTLSFLLPLEYLLKFDGAQKDDRKIRAVILEPTRELAMQVQE